MSDGTPQTSARTAPIPNAAHGDRINRSSKQMAQILQHNNQRPQQSQAAEQIKQAQYIMDRCQLRSPDKDD